MSLNLMITKNENGLINAHLYDTTDGDTYCIMSINFITYVQIDSDVDVTILPTPIELKI